MKMKKALSIILGGALLVGSSSFIFANDAIQLTNNTIEQPAVVTEVSLETTKTPNVTIEVLDEVINGEELEEELLELIEEISEELEDEIDDEEDEEDEIEDEKDEEEDEENQLVLEKLYDKLLKYQLVYDRVPVQAKPAIEKNMKMLQLKIVDNMIKMNLDLETLIPEINVEQVQTQLSILKEELKNEELTEETKQELINSIAALENKISNHEEMTNLVEFINENKNWKKELQNTIHEEFKAEKAKIKADSKIVKEEIKEAKKELKEQMKANKEDKKSKEKIMKTDKKIKEKISKVKSKAKDKKTNNIK